MDERFQAHNQRHTVNPLKANDRTSQRNMALSGTITHTHDACVQTRPLGLIRWLIFGGEKKRKNTKRGKSEKEKTEEQTQTGTRYGSNAVNLRATGT